MTGKRTSMIVIAVCVVCSIGIAFIIAARWKIHSMARGPHGALPHMSQTAPPNEVGRPSPPDVFAIEPLPPPLDTAVVAIRCIREKDEMSCIPLDAAVVSTGGLAVIALKAGHRTGGGRIVNPLGAIRPLCIREKYEMFCIAPGGAYNLVPSGDEVSVVSEDSNHSFDGYGMLAEVHSEEPNVHMEDHSTSALRITNERTIKVDADGYVMARCVR